MGNHYELYVKDRLKSARHQHGDYHPRTLEIWAELIICLETRRRLKEADYEFERLVRTLVQRTGGYRENTGVRRILEWRDRRRAPDPELSETEATATRRASSQRSEVSLGEAETRLSGSSTDGQDQAEHNKETSPQAERIDADIIDRSELYWNEGRVSLRFHLSRSTITKRVIDLGVRKLNFEIDGQDVGESWIRSKGQNDWNGKLYIESTIQYERRTIPNLNPQTLRVYGRGEDVAWVDPIDPLFAEDILIYGIRQGAFHPSDHVMNREHDYVFRFPRTYELQGDFANSNASSKPASAIIGPWKVVRLERGWPEDLSIMQDGDTLWRVNLSQQKEGPLLPKLRLEVADGMKCWLGGKTRLQLNGIPEGVEGRSIILGDREIQLQRGLGWITREAVSVDLNLALGRVPFRARLGGAWANWRLRVANGIRPMGLLTISRNHNEGVDEWRIHPKSDEIDIFGRTPRSVGRILRGNEPSRTSLWEGKRKVSPHRSGELAPTELRGLGEPLSFAGESKDNPTLAEEVVDRGRFRWTLIGSLTLNGAPKVELREQSGLGENYQWCFFLGEPRRPLRLLKVACEAADPPRCNWDLPTPPCDTGSILAVGLAFEGVRIGAWWNIRAIARRLDDGRDNAQAFRMFASHLRWLRAPVLHQDILNPLRQAASDLPIDFVHGWLHAECLDAELRIEDDIFEREDAAAVARNVLWNLAPNIGAREMASSIYPFLGPTPDIESWRSLGEICPPLMARIMKHFKPHVSVDQARSLRNHFMASHELPHSDHDQRAYLQDRVSQQLGRTPDKLNLVIKQFVTNPTGDSELAKSMSECKEGRSLLCVAVIDHLFSIHNT